MTDRNTEKRENQVRLSIQESAGVQGRRTKACRKEQGAGGDVFAAS